MLKKLRGLILLAVIGAVILAVYLLPPIKYTIYNNDFIYYEKATVVEIINETTAPSDFDSKRLLGTQTVKVKINSGEMKGQAVEIKNPLSTEHNIYVRKGQKIIIKIDKPENIPAFYSVYNYDRTTGLLLIAAIVVLILVIVARSKGLRSLLGLLVSVLIIGFFMLPAIYNGGSPVLITLLTAALCTVFSMLILNGFTEKSVTAIISVLLCLIVSVVMFVLFEKILSINGYNLDTVGELILISQNTGLKISELLFCGILISSLGAVMDMTMSISACIYEIAANYKQDTKKLIKTAFEVGKDMIGTNMQTLVLAFAGTALTTVLILIGYGVSVDQLLSSDYLSIEILNSLSGCLAVILCVPVTVFVYLSIDKIKRKNRIQQ